MKRRIWMVAVPAALGLAVLIAAVKQKAPPQRAALAERAHPARVIQAPAPALVPRALGYGSVTPGQVWQAVAEVKGRIVELHPLLKKGAILPAGALLVRIDDADYRLAATQAEADISAVQAQIAELQVREQNTRVSLEIEQRALALGDQELERKRNLLQRKLVSQTDVDQEERGVLALRQSVQTQRSALNLIPAQLQVQQAQLALSQARLEAARLDLARTRVQAPFDVRIAEENVEPAQFAAQGQVLLTADGIGSAEVVAQVPIDKLRAVVPSRDGNALPNLDDLMNRLPELLGLAATVRLRSGDLAVQWPARFDRISDGIDPQTRTVGVVVVVDRPYAQAVPGERPPLLKNMYVEVELRGPPKPPLPVLPRSALRDGGLYLVDADDRLRRRPVSVGTAQGSLVVIRSGLAAGEQVVVSDLVPAVEGMLIAPERDQATEQALVAEAGGEGELK